MVEHDDRGQARWRVIPPWTGEAGRTFDELRIFDNDKLAAEDEPRTRESAPTPKSGSNPYDAGPAKTADQAPPAPETRTSCFARPAITATATTTIVRNGCPADNCSTGDVANAPARREHGHARAKTAGWWQPNATFTATMPPTQAPPLEGAESRPAQ